MDNRPIGVFDSGVGGLTVVKEIHQTLPSESIIYVGDTARVPYGNRSAETIITYTKQIIQYLLDQNVKAVVIACSTASAQALEVVKPLFPIPIFGVIEPVSQASTTLTQTQHIGIIGTKGTINSQAFPHTIHRLNPHLKVDSQACPLLVPCIEENITSGLILKNVLHLYLNKFITPSMDTLILGCTHYPVISDAINQYIGREINLLNPGTYLAETLRHELLTQSLQSDRLHQSVYQYYTTDEPSNFIAIADNIFSQPISSLTQKINLI